MPRISVIVVCYNMAREVPRTVRSFLPPYQGGLRQDDVEVIVLENGSPKPIPENIRASWPPAVRYINVPDPLPSPASALNLGVRLARAPIVCPVIDGARMASPGLLLHGLTIQESHPGAFVASVGFHLGQERQQIAVLKGYNQDLEDELLASVDWETNGYRLFEIAATAGSAKGAWFGSISESNAPILTKAFYESIKGFDTAFKTPGGGLVNLDFFNRCVSAPDTPYFLLLGEGTFHQFHGGVTTSKSVRDVEEDGRTTFARYAEEYHRIRGKTFGTVVATPKLYGNFRSECCLIAQSGLNHILEYIAANRKDTDSISAEQRT